MSLETAALDHSCNVVRRALEDDLEGLDLMFLVFEDGTFEKTLNNKRAELRAHPAGGAFLPYLNRLSAKERIPTRLAGIHETRRRNKYLPFLSRRAALAVFLVNAGDFPDKENARPHIYHLVGHALALRQSYQKKKKDRYETGNGFIAPVRTPLQMARANMLADSFAAALQALNGRTIFLKKMAQKRAMAVLQAEKGYKAELYPYPITADTVREIFDDLRNMYGDKRSSLDIACAFMREIDETYGKDMIGQWQNFAYAAQTLAWLGHDKTRVLGAAIYTSEDAYIRAMAYLVAEILNLEPPRSFSLDTYNPFTDPEANARLHRKKSLQVFETCFSKRRTPDDPAPFNAKARLLNEKLLGGDTTGWCAHALLSASGIEEKDRALKTFETALAEMPWPVLEEVSARIIERRRGALPFSSQALIEELSNNIETALIAETLKKAAP